MDGLGHQSIPGQQQSPSSAWLGNGGTVNRINIFIVQKLLAHSDAVGWAFLEQPTREEPRTAAPAWSARGCGDLIANSRQSHSGYWRSAWPSMVMSSQPLTDSPSQAGGCCKQQSIFHRLCCPGRTALPEHHLWWSQWKLIHSNHCFRTEHADRWTHESGCNDSVFPLFSWAVY